jgi:hypothetical protein
MRSCTSSIVALSTVHPHVRGDNTMIRRGKRGLEGSIVPFRLRDGQITHCSVVPGIEPFAAGRRLYQTDVGSSAGHRRVAPRRTGREPRTVAAGHPIGGGAGGRCVRDCLPAESVRTARLGLGRAQQRWRTVQLAHGAAPPDAGPPARCSWCESRRCRWRRPPPPGVCAGGRRSVDAGLPGRRC